MQFLFDNRALLQHLGVVALFIAAWRWGSAPERWSAGMFLMMLAAEIIYHFVFGVPLVVSKMDVGHFAMDVAATSGLLAIALCANRIYPMWLASLQLISFFTYLAKNFSGEASMTAYQILVVAPSYFMMMVLAGGIVFHRRRLRKFGPYRSWRISPPCSDSASGSSQ